MTARITLATRTTQRPSLLEWQPRLFSKRESPALRPRTEDLLGSEAPELSIATLTAYHLDPRLTVCEVLDEGHELEGSPACSCVVDRDLIAGTQARPRGASSNLALGCVGHDPVLSAGQSLPCHAWHVDAPDKTGQVGTSPTTRTFDLVAAGVSTAADHGAAVAVLVLFDAWRRGRPLRTVVVRLSIVGVPIVLLNTLLKRLVDRPRPEGDDHSGVPVRAPSSSSFPSGHTLAATAAAVALPDTRGGQGVALVAAGVVGWSRLRLRAHHVGDVVGGVVIGGLLGMTLRRVLDAVGRE
jgi:undecaprenyl-diphosphatase